MDIQIGVYIYNIDISINMCIYEYISKKMKI